MLGIIDAVLLRRMQVDWKRNLIFVRGAVPGNAGEFVYIKDAVKKPHDPARPPPSPTYHFTEEDQQRMKQWEELPDLPAMERERLRDLGQLPDDAAEEPPFEIVMDPPEIDPRAYTDTHGHEF